PEVLRGMAGIPGLPTPLASFLQDGRLLIFGLLIVLGSIFYPQGMITPELLKKLTALFQSRNFTPWLKR
ncbi:MAG: hypothetical protein ACKO5Q_24310, partial [Microcystaceae cyanobacterium]